MNWCHSGIMRYAGKDKYWHIPKLYILFLIFWAVVQAYFVGNFKSILHVFHIISKSHYCVSTGTYIHYRQKIWNIFHISEVLYFVGCVRYLFIWLTFLQSDITFGELIHTQLENEPRRFKNNYFGPFSLLESLEFLLSNCHIIVISVRMIIRDIMRDIIVNLPPRLVRSTGD